MIQRIQSVWLLLASACAFLSLKLPYYSGTSSKTMQFQLLTGATTYKLLILTIVIGLLSLLTIFLFKNRVTQMRLCVLGIFLEALLIFLYYRQVSFLFTSGNYALTSLLHSGIILFFVLAARAINKDEKMVKESDRLR